MKKLSKIFLFFIFFCFSFQSVYRLGSGGLSEIPVRKDRKAFLGGAAGMMVGAVGGLAAGALLGSLFGDGETEEKILEKLKLDLILQNGSLIHGSIDKGNSVHSITLLSSKIGKNLAEFERELIEITQEMKSTISNAGQTQNRHINQITKS